MRTANASSRSRSQMSRFALALRVIAAIASRSTLVMDILFSSVLE
jgi:hypothetical protein